MSIEYLNSAFKADIKPSSLKFVLVALCDYANEVGEAYPSIQTIVNKTSLNRKTTQSNLQKLIELNLIKPTGKMVGRTKQIPVFKINLKECQKRERSQKRDYTENGTDSTSNDPKNGTSKESQKRDIEPSVDNHQLNNNHKDIYLDLKTEFNISQESIDKILKHRREIKSKKPTPKAIKIILKGMKKTVDLEIMPSMGSCLKHYIEETVWQSFKPEYFGNYRLPHKSKHSGLNQKDYSKDATADENLPQFILDGMNDINNDEDPRDD